MAMQSRRLRRCRLWVEELEGRLVPAALALSTNWSGYAIAGGPGSISYVAGSWNVPAVSNTSGFSATWVGIDGFNSRTVEQIGTESDFVGGQASYYAWYEMYPNPTVQIPQPIQPGDAITASVAYAAGTGFTLTINDSSWSTPFTQTIQSSAPRTSAEWVVESPSVGNHVLPIDNFGTETFSSASATVGGTTGSIKTTAPKTQVDQIDMVGSRGTLKDSTSALNPAGTGFTVTYNASAPSRPDTVKTHAVSSSSHDTNIQTTLIIVVVPTAPAFSPLLVNVQQPPPQTITLPLTPITVTAQPTPTDDISAPQIIPFVGTPGVTDILQGGDGHNAPGGVAPAGPAVPQGQGVLPAGPQLRPDGIATPSASSMVLPEGNEGAAMVQDGDVASNDASDNTERTVEVAGIVLTLALSGSAGVSIGERTARVKPGDFDPIQLRVR